MLFFYENSEGGPACDVAVDPIDGTSLTANGMNGTIYLLLSPNVAQCMTQNYFMLNQDTE